MERRHAYAELQQPDPEPDVRRALFHRPVRGGAGGRVGLEGAHLDEVLPHFDVESAHSIRVGAPAEVVYRSAWKLDMSGSRLIRTLFALRGLPTSALSRSGLSRIRFKVIREDPGTGFVLGIIGQFWTASGRLVDFDPTGFARFVTPGYAKATWSFTVAADGSDAAVLSTVTRVQCLDAASRRRFRLYWLIVGPFSGLIRKEVLRVVRAEAESSVGRGAT